MESCTVLSYTQISCVGGVNANANAKRYKKQMSFVKKASSRFVDLSKKGCVIALHVGWSRKWLFLLTHNS